MRPGYRGRQDGWDYGHRWQAKFPSHSQIGGLDYDEELAGANGMHFHFWVPAGTSAAEGRKLARAAAFGLVNERDIVSYSWEIAPEEP